MAVEHIPALIASPHTAAVSFTGSSRAGHVVAGASGRAGKPCILELGGSDPYIILPGADLDRAVTSTIQSRLTNNGQSCIAAKRLIVHQEVYQDVRERLLEQAQGIFCSPPMEETSVLGPMAREDLRQELHRQVMASVQAGAELLCGGTIPDDSGWYYPSPFWPATKPAPSSVKKPLVPCSLFSKLKTMTMP